jgi:hypothetical protein
MRFSSIKTAASDAEHDPFLLPWFFADIFLIFNWKFIKLL